MRDIKANFDKILEALKSLLQNEVDLEGNFSKISKKPKFSDLELVNLTSEYLSIGNKNLLFKKLRIQYQNELPDLIDHSQYNRHKKALFSYIEQILKQLHCAFSSGEDVFKINFMPLEVYSNASVLMLKICKKDFSSSHEKGFCVSQNQYV